MQINPNSASARTGDRRSNRASMLHSALHRTMVVSLLALFFGSLPAAAVTLPDQMTVIIPAGTNNAPGAGGSTCSLSGAALVCNNNVSTTNSTDDVILSTIRFVVRTTGPQADRTVTFNGANGQIIPGLASVFLEGGGGTNVNAEWGDNDNNSDGDHNPFAKAGFPNAPQESQDVDVINATLLQVFRSLNLMEGVDGEDENFRLQIVFENGIRDNNGSAVDPTPEIIIFERGLNSDVAIQLLLEDGGVTDELTIPANAFRDSGINADTVEINGGQPMGVVGIDLNEFTGAGFNPTTDVVVGARFGSAGGGADIFGVFGTTLSPIDLRDRGDAPDSYGTLNASNGPSHVLDRNLFIGLPPDPELDGQPSADATGDDPVGTADESLLYQFPSGSFVPGDTFSVTVPVFNQTGASALICGWVDFNRNGSFQNADANSGSNSNSERICATVSNGSVSTGTNPDTATLDFIVPADYNTASSSGVFARFRITSDWTQASDASPLGPARTGPSDPGADGIGEVEDVLIGADYGDLPAVYPVASHIIVPLATSPYLGGAPDREIGAFFTVDANGDDLAGNFDEDGVVLDAAPVADINGIVTFGASITATNPSALPSQVCGWFDFDKDGVLGNQANTSTTASDPDFASRSDIGERSCLQVPANTTNGLFRMSWTIPESAQGQTGQFYFRFRISNDPDMFDSSLLSPAGSYVSGEVEDYRSEDVGTLPVSIASFNSRYTAEGLEIRWMTVSETRNLGFHVWGDRGFGLEQLNAEMIPSDSLDPTTPHSYSLVIPGVADGQVEHLAVTAIDYSGKEEVYGMFEPGRNYGRKAAPAPIPWQDIKQQIDLRAQQIRAARKQQSIVASFHSGGNSRPDYVDLRVTTPGLQQVTWQMLADAGLDLSRARPEHIAVTLKGEAVSRDIVGAAPAAGKSAQSNLIGNARGTTPDNGFGADGVIRFWGETPSISDALYLDHYVYRISVDPSKALAATTQAGATTGPVDQYTAWQRVNEQVRYHFSTPGNDPWFATLLRGGRNNNHEVVFAIDDALITAGTARVMIRLGGLTAYDTTPDHHARVEVNGQIVADRFFDGNRVEQLDIEIPASLLRIGQNTVRVTAPGGANAPNDLFVVDTIDLGYPRRMVAQQDRLLIEQSNGRGQIQAEGFSNDDLLAYAVTGNGLVRLSHEAAANGWVVAATVADTDARYWLSTVSATAQPQVVATGRNSNLLAGSTADFLVIAHPAFLPTTDDEPHPLNDYLAQRRSEGWKVRTFDITEIQAVYGHGMPLPGAVTAFLGAAEQRFRYEHVLLVGGDSYDYTDRLGHGTVSFIPTRYAPTRYITHTPSDALLADLDGDGLADKAIGRWPVRSLDDLRSIVTKTLEWPNIANPHSAVWVTDSEDPNSGSFRDQAERMIASLHSEGWNEDRLDRVYFGEVGPRPGLSIAASVRMAFFDQLAEGRALTGFVGHGSPSMWSFQGLLAPDDLKDLHNEGEPTLIGTMTCYTTYFVSPSSDTVAHRWLNGYREDAAGNPIPGIPNGAVAVHGAAALSDYNQNESFASLVLSHQLKGQTLGRATLLARREAARTGLSDLVVNWTLLGDPTLILH